MTKIEQDWIKQPNVQRIMALFEQTEAFFVGGCVRNALLDEPISDIDIATSKTPDEVLKLAKEAGIKAVPTGIEHGTVTLVQNGEPFEITTFRKDVSTDGRRATVAFSTDMREDALRRDFTMNAIYADRDGQICDPLGGLPDVEARRIRFIETPRDRITEDYLRILRFFRFQAYYGHEVDEEALAACAELHENLASISKERIGSELLKLLSAPDPSVALGAMHSSGVLNTILAGADPKMVFVLTQLELDKDPIARLAVLAPSDLVPELRLSKSQKALFSLLRRHMSGTVSLSEISYFEGKASARLVAGCRAAVFETAVSTKDIEDIEFAAQQVLPISAADLMPHYEGPSLGAKLKELEKTWIKSGFVLSKSALLGELGSHYE